MKKKLVTILLSACVAASLAACGNSDDTADKTEPQAKQNQMQRKKNR